MFLRPFLCCGLVVTQDHPPDHSVSADYKMIRVCDLGQMDRKCSLLIARRRTRAAAFAETYVQRAPQWDVFSKLLVVLGGKHPRKSACKLKIPAAGAGRLPDYPPHPSKRSFFENTPIGPCKLMHPAAAPRCLTAGIVVSPSYHFVSHGNIALSWTRWKSKRPLRPSTAPTRRNLPERTPS